ncbi:MAG: AMP-binding protein [Chloroflexi bacterium]|nr:AMP-binding protein [Chloroflexota bacterium]
MNATVLLTGATGFLGTEVARRVLANDDCNLVVLVRAADVPEAERRLSRAWWKRPEMMESIGGRVRVVCGDVAEPKLGLDDSTYSDLAHTITHIIHCAAELRLDGPLDELRRVNVGGTANVLELARAAHGDHGLSRFAHVSTAYVAGRRTGEVPEEALSAEWGFKSSYEASKYEGESLVQAAKAEMPVSVFRPGMVVGDSQTGEIKTFNTIYYPLRLYLTGHLRILPCSSSNRVNIVPVDYVAGAIARLTFVPEAAGRNFHLTASAASLPKAGEFIEYVRDWAKQHLGASPHRPVFVPIVPEQTQDMLEVLGGKGRSRLKTIASLLPYFSEDREFLRENTDRLLGGYDMNWREVMSAVLGYAVQMGFMHGSERTVHEQVVARLGSKNRPVNYHDVVDGGVVDRSGAEVRQEILVAAGALERMSVQPGDRVALVGLNSTRYLALDVAIGLIGAISVPLYYTSPPADIDGILHTSGARVLLVGAPKLLERIGEFARELPVISFCRGPLPEGLPREVMTWEEFLNLGFGARVPGQAPVTMVDTASLRYTSGTTGRPRGVAFNHANLRWMAEAVAALPSWKVRNRGIKYLSFLPMNHVVEGILANYSPYYAPAPLDIYFLEEFRDLQRALPLVRPNVLFSVPRFYEKVWDGLRQSAIGRRYLAAEQGVARSVLGRLVRFALLKRAGLDKCDQLITGSAPASESLLWDFHELGIEIHNAYGLTEAPLVTINRLGANRIGTTGEPLPETELAIAKDGEVLVRGPQVAAGHFDASTEVPSRDGWLLTGDLGRITGDGSLVLEGRKKELIVTSYGKNVLPAKVEVLLREIPGVAEAMLAGDGRPYCVALMWMRKPNADERTVSAIRQGVQEANSRLAHPEQIKKWALLPNTLSVENGDLTPNLKLKRRAVAERYADVLSALYDGTGVTGTVLHMDESGDMESWLNSSAPDSAGESDRVFVAGRTAGMVRL